MFLKKFTVLNSRCFQSLQYEELRSEVRGLSLKQHQPSAAMTQWESSHFSDYTNQYCTENGRENDQNNKQRKTWEEVFRGSLLCHFL